MAFPLTGLVSYWKLDEASGTRVDSHGTQHLTPTNAPVGAAGKIGNGCDFERDSAQCLSHADPTPLGDEDFTYTLWFKRETVTEEQVFLAKDAPTGRSYKILIFLQPAFRLGADAVNVGVGGGNDTNWHFLVAWHDAAADTIHLQLDNGAAGSTPTGGVFPPLTATPVQIGADGFGGVSFDGLLDEVGLWRRVLTAQERTDLYNGGAGLAYPASAAAGRPLSLGYWKQGWTAA